MMNDRELDEKLRRSHGEFKRDGELLRERLLANLPQRDIHKHFFQRRWVMRTTISSLAASVVVAASVWFFAGPGATRAYGIEDVPEQISKARSIHAKGVVMSRFINGEKIPMEYFVERSGKFYQTFTRTVPEGQGVITFDAGYKATDGRRYIAVDHKTKEVTLGKEIPLIAEIEVEGFIQNRLYEGFNPDALKKFAKKAELKTESGIVHIYQREELTTSSDTIGRKDIVWLDPRNGLPVKLMRYMRVGPYLGPDFDANDHLIAEYSLIEADVTPRPWMFDFTPPAGYAVKTVDRKPEDILNLFPEGVAINDGRLEVRVVFSYTQLEVRLAININDRAILVYWAAYGTPDGQPFVEHEIHGPVGKKTVLPDITVKDDQGDYDLFFLRTDPVEVDWEKSRRVKHYRWSLLVPRNRDRSTGIGEPTIRWSFPDHKGRRSPVVAVKPLAFSPGRLPEIVAGVQRLTLPAESKDRTVLTLKDLERLIERVSKSEE